MKLTIKTLQQFTFKLDIEPEKTVKELKEQIEREHGKDYPIAHQKLIYSGKILADDSKLSEYEVDEKKFVVLMITRPPPPPKVQQPQIEKTTSSTGNKKLEEAKLKTKPADEKRQAKAGTTSQTTTTTTNTTTQSSLSPAPPAGAPPTASSVPTTTPTAAPNTPSTPTNLSTATTTTNTNVLGEIPARGRGGYMPMEQQNYMTARLSNITSQPQFRQIQELIQQSPHLLSSTIESLASTDPDMYNFISENPDIFVSALNQAPMSSLNLSPSSRSSTTGAAQQQSDQGMRDLQQGVRNMTSGGRHHVVEIPNVSEHDKEAIERLKELGFTEIQAYQAYIACDKDEQLAANLLFQMEQ